MADEKRVVMLVAVASRRNQEFAIGVHYMLGREGPFDALGRMVGSKTGNQAAYEGILHGIGKALQLGTTALSIATDVQFIADQINGKCKVRGDLVPLHAMVMRLLGCFTEWKVQWVPRKENPEAQSIADGVLKGQTTWHFHGLHARSAADHITQPRPDSLAAAPT